MRSVDLNVDIGEGSPYDEDLLLFATSANVCCGAHAGSRELTGRTVDLCRSRGVRVGMHPGYPDRASIGRLPMDATDAMPSILDQVRAFPSGAAYLKPHGALYNLSAEVTVIAAEPDLGHASLPEQAARLVLMALQERKLPLMGLRGTGHARIADAAGVPLIAEGFADRTTLPDGRLLPRSEPGAVLDDPEQVVRQALLLAHKVDSICIHGDTPGCVEMAERIVGALRLDGFEVRAPQ